MFQKSPEFDADMKELVRVLRKAHKERGHLVGVKGQDQLSGMSPLRNKTRATMNNNSILRRPVYV